MLNIIPKPLKCTFLDGTFLLRSGLKFSVCTELESTNNILLSYLNKYNPKKSNDANLIVKFDNNIASEGYTLKVTKDRIMVTASAPNGVFYAVMSLLQMIENDKVAAIEIIDSPRFKHRAFMLDEARHFWGKKTVKEYLDMMSFLKMNILHWHLSEDQGWRVEIKKYPLLTTKGTTRKNSQLSMRGHANGTEAHDDIPYGKGCFYTQEDIKEIVAYAKERFINIIPEIDMPGHLVSAIACYPNLSCTGEIVDVSNRWGILDLVGCCGKEDIYTFAKDVINELAPLFPYKHFHIGGDEVPKTKWKTCPNCQAKIKELGLKNELELQGHFNNVISAHLASLGFTTIGWNEILEASQISSNTIIQWWIGGGHNKAAQEWIAAGNKAIISRHDYCYCDYLYSMIPLAKTYSFDLDKLGIPNSMENCIIGVEIPLWTEYVVTKEKLHLNSFPRLHAIAEVGWTAKELRNYADFDTRLKNKHLGILLKKGINFAKPHVYNLVGLKGFLRKAKQVKHWHNTPNCELDLNKK